MFSLGDSSTPPNSSNRKFQLPHLFFPSFNIKDGSVFINYLASRSDKGLEWQGEQRRGTRWKYRILCINLLRIPCHSIAHKFYDCFWKIKTHLLTLC
uniref:Uncharacterized protein n=1 Tax=Daphnia magna TaxID=35525 RepID=A0A0P6CTX5_9CRUS